MCGCFYLPFDEAGGGVGGCAPIWAFEAALAFRQLPGQLRASRRHMVQLHTLVFLLPSPGLFPPQQPLQNECCRLRADRPRGWIWLQVPRHFSTVSRHLTGMDSPNGACQETRYRQLENINSCAIRSDLRAEAYVLSVITPTGSSPIMHQSAVLFKAGVEKKTKQFCLKRLSFNNK